MSDDEKDTGPKETDEREADKERDVKPVPGENRSEPNEQVKLDDRINNGGEPPVIEISSVEDELANQLGRDIGLKGRQGLLERTDTAEFRVLNAQGEPSEATALEVTVANEDGETTTVRATSGPTGYATADMSAIDFESADEISVEPVGGAGKSTTIDPERLAGDGVEVVNVGEDGDSGSSDDTGLPGYIPGLQNQVFPRPPSIEDVENAPELFNPSVVEENGNCSIDFTAKVDVHENFFNQLVRMGPEEDLFEEFEDDHLTLRGQVPFEMTEDYLDTEIESSSSEDPYLERAGRPTFGTMNVYKQSWTRVGHSLGKLLHSLTLAPCESTEVSIIEWSRSERGRRDEATTAQEEKSHEMHRDRMIEEIVGGMIKEDQWGSSSSVQGGAGVSGGIAGFVGEALGAVGVSIGGGGAHSTSESHGRRRLQATTVQNLTDSVVQGASSMRSLRSSVVTQSQEIERDEVRTRAVENHNRNHAMTVQYFQVLEHYNIQTELVDETDVLMIPYDIPMGLFEEMPAFEAFGHGEGFGELYEHFSEVGADVADRLTTSVSWDFPNSTVTFELEYQVAEAVDDAIATALRGANTPADLADRIDAIADDAWSVYESEASKKIADQFDDVSTDDVRIQEDGDVATPSFIFQMGVTKQRLTDALRTVVSDVVDSTSADTGPDADVLEESDLIGWLDRNADKLRDLVPAEQLDAFDALYRLTRTPEVYETSRPTVTASNWTVEIREAWRPGVTILVHTTDGQTVTLDQDEGTDGSAVAMFSSPPVDVGAIDAVELNFAPETATKSVVRSVAETLDDAGDAMGEYVEVITGQDDAPFTEEVEEAREFDISRIRVTAHTDPTDALPESKAYELVDDTDVDRTLTANDPGERWTGITVPEPDILETETRRYDDYAAVESLINHVQANRMAYLRQLWLNEDPDRRALRFQRYAYPVRRNGTLERVPLLDLIENEPLGVVGNSVAFRLLDQGQLDDYEEIVADDLSRSKLVSLPTRGVYAETLLSHCNATEIRDVDRIPTERSRCQTEAPEITGVTPGSRHSPDQLQPTVPESTVAMQQPPAAPEPTGLSGALEVLSSPNIFRDMSMGSETVQAANSLAQKAMEESGEAREGTLGALTSLLESAGAGGNGAGDQSAEEAAVSAAQDVVRRGREAAQQQATQAHRQSDPVRNRDHQQNLKKAYEDGVISKEAYEEGTKRLNNADKSEAEPASDRLAGSGATSGSTTRTLPCREFTPTADYVETIIIDTVPNELQGETVRNWGDDEIHHFPYPAVSDADADCRDPGSISEIIFHEPATGLDSWSPSDMDKPKGVHLSIERDGTIANHNDLVEFLHHAGEAHNKVSIGVEILNPVWNDIASTSNLPTIPVDWPGREGVQPQGDYVLPTQAQCEAAASLVDLLTDPGAGHGMASGAQGLAIPRQWFGRTNDGYFRMGNPRDVSDSLTVPGIWAHGHFGGAKTHVDGYFVALYTLLRHEGQDSGARLSASDAYEAAKTVARSDTSPDLTWRRMASSDRFDTPLANIQQYVGSGNGSN